MHVYEKKSPQKRASSQQNSPAKKTPEEQTQNEEEEKSEVKKNIQNPCRDSLFSFLRAKDDSLILLTTLCILSIFVNKQNFSSSILEDTLLNDNFALNSQEQKNYQGFLAESMLRALAIDPPLRIITHKFIVDCIIELVYHIDPNECNNLNKNQELLIPRHNQILQEISNYIKHNLQMALRTPQIADICTDLVEQEWRIFNNNLQIGLSDALQKAVSSALTIMPPADEPIPNITLAYRLPVAEFETVRCDIQLFFLHRILLSKLKPGQDFKTYENPFEQKSGEQNNLLQVGNTMEVDTKEKIIIECKVNQNSKQKPRYFIDDEDYFLLIKPRPQLEHSATIKTAIQMRNVEAVIDIQDSKQLHIKITGNQPHNLCLNFEDALRCIWVKRQLEEQRKIARQFDLGLMENLINCIGSNLN